MRDIIISKRVICDWDENIADFIKQDNIEHFEKELKTMSDIDQYCDILNQTEDIKPI